MLNWGAEDGQMGPCALCQQTLDFCIERYTVQEMKDILFKLLYSDCSVLTDGYRVRRTGWHPSGPKPF